MISTGDIKLTPATWPPDGVTVPAGRRVTVLKGTFGCLACFCTLPLANILDALQLHLMQVITSAALPLTLEALHLPSKYRMGAG